MLEMSMSELRVRARALLLGAALIAAACAPASPRASEAPPQAPAASVPADAARKTITIGIASAFYAFSVADRGLNVGGA